MSNNNWIFEVLDDIEKYASLHKMKNLEQSIDDIRLAARTDIALTELKRGKVVRLHSVRNRSQSSLKFSSRS